MNVFKRTIFCISLFLFSIHIFAQAPTITSTVGYPVGKYSKEVAYGNGKYVLISENNALYQSSDASGWSRITTSGLSSNSMNFLVFAEGYFVMVGNSGTIQTSADGITWSTTNSGTTEDLYRIYHFNGRFYATGRYKGCFGSDDGFTWNEIILNGGLSDDEISSMTYGNGIYIIATRSGLSPNNVYRSSTAESNSWTLYQNPMNYNSVNRIQFLKDRFFAFHSGNDMYSSTDGISWTLFSASTTLTHPDESSIPWGNGHQIFNGIYDGTIFHFYGSSAYYSGYGSNFTSTDGVNLTLQTKSAYIVPQQSSYINGLYLVVGNEGIVSSSDGVVYKHSGGSYTDLVKTANKYIAVGGLGNGSVIYNSPDFQTWTGRSVPNARELYSVATNGSVVIAGGSRALLKSVNDGDSWTSILDAPENSYYNLTYGNGIFVAFGWHDIDGAFFKISSDNGDSWTTVITAPNWYYRMRYVNGGFFALGYSGDSYLGAVMYSEDGLNWTDVTPVTTYPVLYYKDVTYDGSNYHVYGIETDEVYAPGNFFTLSTQTPDISSSYGNKAGISNLPEGVVLGGTYDEGVLLYSNGIFTGSVLDVATGQDYLIYSNDGTSYTAIAQNSYSAITAGIAEGNEFNLVSRFNGFFSAEFPSQLPVTYNYFRGVAANKTSKLNWATSSEIGSRGFEVMHSINGSDWKQIGFVNTVINTLAQKTYSFDHTTPAEGINYYRLVQVDVDGKKSAGRIITVSFGNNMEIVVYPNPVLDYLNIRNDKNLAGQVKILNAAGQPVYVQKLSGAFTRINMSGFKSGLYHVEIITGKERKTVPVFKN